MTDFLGTLALAILAVGVVSVGVQVPWDIGIALILIGVGGAILWGR